MFDINSRYYYLEDKFLTTQQGDLIAYKGRRFLPTVNSNSKAIAQMRYVVGDRLDLIAHRILGDALSYWQLMDANMTMHPRQLTEQPGTVINVPLLPLQINSVI